LFAARTALIWVCKHNEKCEYYCLLVYDVEAFLKKTTFPQLGQKYIALYGNRTSFRIAGL
jgi:hypothetical protein